MVSDIVKIKKKQHLLKPQQKITKLGNGKILVINFKKY